MEALTSQIRMGLKLFVLSIFITFINACGDSGTAQSDSEETSSEESTYTQSDSILDLDEAWFWDGETIMGDIHVPDARLCGSAGPCPEYKINVAPGGKRLRVGIDTAERSETFVIELIDPEGILIATDSSFNQFNSEALADDPVEGLWTVRIRPENVSQASYRMRAKLESEATVHPSQGERRALLPNLKTVPPYEFTFVAPANPLNGLYPPDTINPPLEAGGVAPISCTADEAAPPSIGGAGAVHCLRFTSGPINMGEGIYDVRFRLVDDTIAGEAEPHPDEALSRIIVGPKTQVVYYSDGTTEEHEAGTYSYHPIHFHFHDDYVLSFEIYEVLDDEIGQLVASGAGNKSGFCPADQLFGNWYEFKQGYETPGGDSPADNCFSPTDGTIGLSVGWGDVYRWQRPGMYVEFDGNGNGRYVVRSLVDQLNNVLESDDTDNVSYAYIQVQGDDILLLERGWGTDPWDPYKVVFSGSGPAQRDPLPSEQVTFAHVTDEGLVTP